MLTILPAAGAVLHVTPDLQAAAQRRGSFSCRVFRELAHRKDMNHVVRSRVSLRNTAKPTGHSVFLLQGCTLGRFSCVVLDLKVAQMIKTKKKFFNNVIIMNAI